MAKSGWKDQSVVPQLVRDETHSQEEIDEADMDMHKSRISGGTSSSPNKKVLSAEAQRILEQQERELNDDQKKELAAKLKDLKLSSRWLPDSALTTYFGKPAFHAYGNGNIKPVAGGVINGEYLKTHNINPHSGGNKPKYSQVFGRALLGHNVHVRGAGSKSPAKNK